MTNQPFSKDALIKDLIHISALPVELAEEGFKFFVHYSVIKEAIIIEYIYVPIEFRRNNYATQFIFQCTVLADLYNENILIEPSPKFGVSRDVLEKLYQNIGFMPYDATHMIYTPSNK